MITRIKIEPGFAKSRGPRSLSRLPANLRLPSKESGYELSSLPVGHTLDVASYFVVVVGDNGAGKSTLLEKLCWGTNSVAIDSGDYDYFTLEATCYKPCVLMYRGVGMEMPTTNPFLLFDMAKRNPSGFERYKEELCKSQGQYGLYALKKYLSAEMGRDARFSFAFDQPEDGISLRRRKEVVDLLANYAFNRQRQIFVGTHEPLFTQVSGAKVINLDEHPAVVCDSENFDLHKYTSGSVVGEPS
jgi:hypothetical protein